VPEIFSRIALLFNPRASGDSLKWPYQFTNSSVFAAIIKSFL
jgi:hypothetical protein